MWRLRRGLAPDGQGRPSHHGTQDGQRRLSRRGAPERPFVPRSLLMQWHITERCNGACRHCYQDAAVRERELCFDDLCGIVGQFAGLLDECERRGGRRVPAHVTVTGGEPFVRDDILDLLDYLAAHRDRFSLAILTNGTLIDARLARFLRHIGPRFVQVSLDGTPAAHDALRGPGNFDAVCAGLRHLVEQRVPTMVSFTATRANHREFGEVTRICRDMRVGMVWSDRLVPIGGAGAIAEQVLSPEETREYVALVAAEARRPRLPRQRGIRVSAHRALQFLGAGGPAYACSAARTLLTVMADGTLVPCRRMPIPAGSLLADEMSALYWRSDVFRALRSVRAPLAGCEGCTHARRCRGGLRCLSYAVRGDYATADPGCWLATAPAAERRPEP